MIQCSVESCESNFNTDPQSNETFFDYPPLEDSDKFYKWTEALGKPPEYFKKDGKLICSRHFHVEDFEQHRTKSDATVPDIKCNLNLLEHAVPDLYLPDDNKSNLKLPNCFIKTELAPCISLIANSDDIKSEELNEGTEGLKKNVNDSASNNCSYDILLIKKELQEKKTLDSNVGENNLIESQVPDCENKPDEKLPIFIETENKSDDSVHKKFKCADCNESFAWSTELKKHKRVTHGTYVCNICLKHVVKLRSLKVHKKTKHNISYVFSCEDCDKAFFKNTELLKHMKIHEKVPTDKCTKCKKKFESDAEFSSHECIIRNKLFQCEDCKRCFVREANLNTHKQKFHLKKDNENKKKYKCDVCNRAFNKNYRLTQHKKLHEKPYQCDTCKRGFSHRAQLKLHQLNHAAVECIHLGSMKY